MFFPLSIVAAVLFLSMPNVAPFNITLRSPIELIKKNRGGSALPNWMQYNSLKNTSF